MKIALISDIHANMPALESVLAHIDARGDCAATYHLGDLVGYAPWPNETVDLIRQRGITGIAGNYDSTVATDYKHCGCRYEDPRQEELSHLSYEWTRKQVTPSTKAFLGSLPFRLDIRPLGGHIAGPTLMLVHGSPTLNTLTGRKTGRIRSARGWRRSPAQRKATSSRSDTRTSRIIAWSKAFTS